MSAPADDREPHAAPQVEPSPLVGRVALVGTFAGLTRREARRALVGRGCTVADDLDADVRLVVVGEGAAPPADLDARIAAVAVLPTAVRILSETELLRILGLLDEAAQARRLYTPAMVADLLGVTTAAVRAWRRRGLIAPVREVRKLPYYDFHEVRIARQLVEWSTAGVSTVEIERQLAALRRRRPDVDRPLAQQSVLIEGRDLLVREAGALVEARGQFRLDFDAATAAETTGATDVEPSASPAAREAATRPLPTSSDDLAPPRSAAALRELAAAADEEGRLSEAVDLLHAALATSGPDAETCFQLADVLYRSGDRGAARERYFAAVELDEDFVEARANLGCLLEEEGRPDLAIAAFEGALRSHEDYPDAHYHLARVLDGVERRDEAESHWRAFLDLVPESPWAETARRRLGTDD